MKQLKRKAENTKQKKKKSKIERRKAFKKVQGMNMVNPNILDTAAYGIIEDVWLKETIVCPEYCCDIFQWCCE